MCIRDRYCRSLTLRSREVLSMGTKGTMMETPKGERLLMAASSQRETLKVDGFKWASVRG